MRLLTPPSSPPPSSPGPQYKCASESPSVSWIGCASGIDANRFLLLVNVTCPDWNKHSVTVTLRADVLKNARGSLDVINVDDEAVGGRGPPCWRSRLGSA